MRIAPEPKPRGIALMVVMIAIFVLSVLAGGFAYSMKVETKLAMNANNEAAALWLGRSGVELARYVLALQMSIPGEPYDSLNQKWAGGPGGLASSNSPLADISLDNVPVGEGTVTVKITDLERKFNINMADEAVLQQALTLVGVDASEIPSISSAILDWIDPDDIPHVNGAESDYYQTLEPPYFAKNRPIDDLSELLLVRGVTLDMYWGSSSTNHAPAAFQRVDRWGRPIEEPTYPVGLVELFTPLSTGRININTASATVLQMIPGMDQNAADQVIKQRSGPDGVDGTEDDTPFRNVGELINAGLSRQAVQQLARYCDVRSRTFQVTVNVDIRGYHRTFYAIVGRNSPRDIGILSFYWK
jgi:type II secretory pathway component PulK